MKNFSVYMMLILLYILLIYLDKSFITTNSKIIDFLTKDYPSEVVQNYMESQKKWWWLNYVVTPLLIGIKALLIAFCLNFLKLLDLPKIEEIKFSDFVFLALVAEFIFIIAGFYKFVNFHWINTDYTMENLQTYYPISLLNLREYISTEKWLSYPLQLVNLFELFYWIFLAWGVRELLDEKISYIKSFGLISLTYGIGLLLWAGTVCFLILNAQY
ncbi:hypothetical protein [Chryseobacterium indoltheticum]|uniref:Yip1 domain-containing protein n=1 Tax=Chryseobacterium indoltheticum TaxID=254 RepID=A0A3G6N471_9FLAO|nr:hypothetical protein [Chryseobacterium indoltheticum]AZA62287.1 hypothetical protein EG340_15140 [Chryseobacterium indoltheticum]